MYRFMADVMIDAGLEVLSEHVAEKNVFSREEDMTEEEIFLRDMDGIERCDCMVAEVSVPSTGVGYEICLAVGLKKPVLCVYEHGAKVSAMVLGNKEIDALSYGDIDELRDRVLEFVASV